MARMALQQSRLPATQHRPISCQLGKPRAAEAPQRRGLFGSGARAARPSTSARRLGAGPLSARGSVAAHGLRNIDWPQVGPLP